MGQQRRLEQPPGVGAQEPECGVSLEGQLCWTEVTADAGIGFGHPEACVELCQCVAGIGTYVNG